MQPEGSLPHSQEPVTCPYPEPEISTAFIAPKDQSKSEALWNVLNIVKLRIMTKCF
jgi:hypothetical protein